MTFMHHVNWQKIRFVYRLLLKPPVIIEKCWYYFINNSFIVNEIKNILCDTYDVDALMDNDIDALKSRILFVQNNEPTMR